MLTKTASLASPNRTGVILALGSTQTLAWGSTYYLPAILAEPMGISLGLPTGLVFGAFSAALVIAAFLGPLAGRRIDLAGGRDVLAVSSIVFAAGLATLGLAQNALTLFAGWAIIGIGMAMGLYEAGFSTLTGIYGKDARGPITGITLLAGFASTICWPISAYIESEAGWRVACFFWAGAHLFVGLPINRFLIPQGAAQLRNSGNGSPPQQADHAPPPPANAMPLLATVFAISWFISTAMAAHLPRLLEQVGASASVAIAAAALIGPAQVAARALEFGLLQRFHPLLAARLAALAHPSGAVAVLIFGAPAAVVFAILHGAGNGILTIAKGTLPLAIFGPAGYGFRQGLLMAPARFGQAGAPFLFAVLMERFGAYALLLSIGLALIGFTALMMLKPAHEEKK